MGTKLLLADDSITIQKVVGIIFSNEDYELTVVGAGDLAIQKALEITPDIMLVDAIMPGRSGYEVCQEVRSDARLKHIPLLLMTGAFEPFDEGKARECGADDFISKPFESQHLVGKVATLLELGRQRLTVSVPSAAPEPVAMSDDRYFAAPIEDPWQEPSEDFETQTGLELAFDDIPDAAVAAETQSFTVPAEPASQKIEVVEADPSDDPWGVFDLIDLDDAAKPAPAVTAAEPFAAPQSEESLPVAEFFADSFEPVAMIESIQAMPESEVNVPAAPVAGGYDTKWEPLEEEAFAFQDEELTPPGETFTVGMGEPLATLTDNPAQFSSEGLDEPELAESGIEPETVAPAVAAHVPAISVAVSPPDESQLREILSSLSRDVIERIVWEVVPDLAESIIREEIRKIKQGLVN